MARIVVVEDEKELAALIAQALRDDRHEVEIFHEGLGAIRRLVPQGPSTLPEPDLIILDIMLPGMDGLEICRRVRQAKITPILMLTAKTTELDKVVGLELGADDYLSKPVSIRELQARVSAVLRRVEMMRSHSETLEGDAQPIVHPGLEVNPVSREVISQGERVALTAKEFDLLHLLTANPGRVFSREYLLDRLWGTNYDGYDRTVDTHILRVRRKLGGPGSPADQIVTLWGVGYKYDRPRPAAMLGGGA